MCNAKNKRFSAAKDNTPANNGCICGQNRQFVDFIHSIRKMQKMIGKSLKAKEKNIMQSNISIGDYKTRTKPLP